jgi:hypothetical protein
MADSDSEWWEELLVADPPRCSAPAPQILQDPMSIVESLLSVQFVRSMPPAPAPGPILEDPTPLVESLVSVQSVRSMPSAPAPAPIFAGSNANRRVSAVSAICVFYAFGTGAGSDFSGSSSAAYSQVDCNLIADRSAKLKPIHLAI